MVGVEHAAGEVPVASFSEFRKSYRPPTLLYSCACCRGGKSRVIQEFTAEAFQKAGGRIVLMGEFGVMGEFANSEIAKSGSSLKS